MCKSANKKVMDAKLAEIEKVKKDKDLAIS